MEHKVFISYSSRDARLAERIYDRLERDGVRCWMSSHDVPPGADFQSCIVNAIGHAELVLLVFSSEANCSNEIAKELSLASKKLLIPARIEDVLPEGAFKFQLTNRQFFDLFEDFDQRLDQLSRLVQSALGGTPLPATMPAARTLARKPSRLPGFAIPLAVVALLAALGIGWFLTRPTAEVASAQATVVPVEPPTGSSTTDPTQPSPVAAASIAPSPAVTEPSLPSPADSRGSATAVADPPPYAYIPSDPIAARTQPSFNCARASTRAERLVCSDDQLARLDRQLSIAYRNARTRSHDRSALQQQQNEWRTRVRDACDETACVASAYADRTRQLDAL